MKVPDLESTEYNPFLREPKPQSQLVAATSEEQVIGPQLPACKSLEPASSIGPQPMPKVELQKKQEQLEQQLLEQRLEQQRIVLTTWQQQIQSQQPPHNQYIPWQHAQGWHHQHWQQHWTQAGTFCAQIAPSFTFCPVPLMQPIQPTLMPPQSESRGVSVAEVLAAEIAGSVPDDRKEGCASPTTEMLLAYGKQDSSMADSASNPAGHASCAASTTSTAANTVAATTSETIEATSASAVTARAAACTLCSSSSAVTLMGHPAVLAGHVPAVMGQSVVPMAQSEVLQGQEQAHMPALTQSESFQAAASLEEMQQRQHHLAAYQQQLAAYSQAGWTWDGCQWLKLDASASMATCQRSEFDSCTSSHDFGAGVSCDATPMAAEEADPTAPPRSVIVATLQFRVCGISSCSLWYIVVLIFPHNLFSQCTVPSLFTWYCFTWCCLYTLLLYTVLLHML